MAVGGNFTSCNCGPDVPACQSPTQPVATVGLCLADGTPIAVTVVRDCAGAVTSEGWINLTTGAWSSGAPPAGVIACGDSRSITTNGTFCDVLEDGTVAGLVLVEYQYAADGSISSVRLVDAITGETYTPTGEVTTCPAGVEQPERDLLQLCDVAEDGTSTPFVRDYARDENGAITGHTDYLLDGQPYTPTGTVGQCQPVECDTTPVCVRPSGVVEFISNADNAVDGSVDPVWTWSLGTLTGPWHPMYRVGTYPGWTVTDPGTTGGTAHWVAPHPDRGTVNTGQPGEGPTIPAATPDWYARASFELPDFADPDTIRVSATILNADQVAVEWRLNNGPWQAVGRAHNSPPYTLPPTDVPGAQAGLNELFVHVRETVFNAPAAGVIMHLVVTYDVGPDAYEQWHRVTCTDGTLYYLDAQGNRQTSIPADSTIVPCSGQGQESCASSVTVLRLCDLDPDVEPNEEGKRCAVPFLRHLVYDCAGALVETRDTSPDGTTPYTPTQVVDCGGGGGVPAMVEVPWEVVGIEPDPESPAGRGLIFTLSPIDDPSTVGTVKVTTSSSYGTSSCPADPPAYAYRNPTTYTFTPDQALRDAATYVRCDLIDFDSFEPITGLNPAPTRLGGNAYWDGTTVRSNDDDETGEMYYDGPPESWTYRVGNTGGGNSCSMLSFAAVSLRAEGCCAGCGGTSGGGESGRTVQEVCVIATAAPDDVMYWTRVIEDGGATIYYLDQNGDRYDNTLPAGHQIVACPVEPEPCRDSATVLLCDVSALDTVTVLDTVNRQDADGWEITSFTDGGCVGYQPPDGPVPGPAIWSAPGYLGVRADRSLGATSCSGAWEGYDAAPIRWVLTKTFTAPEDGMAVVTADGFRADGGGRVRVNGQDVGLYGQWNQPAVGGSSQVPVTAGPNVIEIEVRDISGPNWLRGRLDIVMTSTEQFMRRTVTDCETGDVVSVVDTTLDGEPYEVTGQVGQCEPAAECCPAPPPETRVDVETVVLCVRGEAGDIVARVLAERVYDDQSGELVEQRLTDLGGVPYTLPDGAELTTCAEPVTVLEECRCDDTDGDGIGDTEYVELIAVATDGTLTTLGTYTPDLAAEYTPVAPADCPDEGAPPPVTVQAHRLEVPAGGSWNADGVPLLQAVTFVAWAADAQITTTDGTSTLHEGESVSWSVARDGDAFLTGPLSVTASAGTVTVTYTTAATS